MPRHTGSTTPTPVAPDDLALFTRYRELFLPAARLTFYDDFAKWIFTVAATVGTLGAAFSSTAFGKLAGLGALAYGVAIILVGLALALATVARSTDLPEANWQSLQDMLAKLQPAVRRKRIQIRVAGAFLGAAFAFAALAPMLTTTGAPKEVKPSLPPQLGLAYTVNQEELRATLLQRTAKPNQQVQARAVALTDKGQVLLAGASLRADADGLVSIDLSAKRVPAEATRILFFYSTEGAAAADDRPFAEVPLRTALSAK